MRTYNKYMDGSRILLGGHRGDRKHYPENTMSAFRGALELGLDAIETDVRMTLDGHLVLIHDRSIARTTNGEGNVDEMTLEELRSFDAGFWKGPEHVGRRSCGHQRVPGAADGHPLRHRHDPGHRHRRCLLPADRHGLRRFRYV